MPLNAAVAPWLRRYVFSVLVVLGLPLSQALAGLLGALAPDALATPPDDCPPLTAMILSPLDAAGHRAALVCRLPTLAAQPCAFGWPAAPDAPSACAAPADPARARPLHQVIADDVAARYRYFLPVTLLAPLSAAVFALAVAGLWRLGGRTWALAGGAAALGAAALALPFRDGLTLRLMTDLTLLRAAQDPAYPWLDVAAWRLAFATLDVAFAAIMAACGAAVALLALVARRADAPDHPTLIRRAWWLRAMLLSASVTLALGVAAAHGLMAWPAALLAQPFADAAAQMASTTALLHWGVIYSAALVLFVGPASLALRLDIAAAEAARAQPGPPLLAQAGLQIDLRHGLTTVLTLAAPMLTGPALELLKIVLGA